VVANKNIGHFLQNKQMVYKAEENAILPEGDDGAPQMIDISVLKRGGFNQFSTKSKAAQKLDDLTLRQEEGKHSSLLNKSRAHGRNNLQIEGNQ